MFEGPILTELPIDSLPMPQRDGYLMKEHGKDVYNWGYLDKTCLFLGVRPIAADDDAFRVGIWKCLDNDTRLSPLDDGLYIDRDDEMLFCVRGAQEAGPFYSMYQAFEQMLALAPLVGARPGKAYQIEVRFREAYEALKKALVSGTVQLVDERHLIEMRGNAGSAIVAEHRLCTLYRWGARHEPFWGMERHKVRVSAADKIFIIDRAKHSRTGFRSRQLGVGTSAARPIYGPLDVVYRRTLKRAAAEARSSLSGHQMLAARRFVRDEVDRLKSEAPFQPSVAL